MTVGSASIEDEEFLRSFRACELPLTCFRHGDHLRLAWLHVRRYPSAEALSLIRAAIQKYAGHHGIAHVYHETITAAWVRLISTHHEETFEEFLTANDEALRLNPLERFWTREALMSDQARAVWVAPDKAPLPPL